MNLFPLCKNSLWYNYGNNYGTETVSFLGPKLWTLLPQEYKDINNLIEFKRKIKDWVPQNCP